MGRFERLLTLPLILILPLPFLQPPSILYYFSTLTLLSLKPTHLPTHFDRHAVPFLLPLQRHHFSHPSTKNSSKSSRNAASNYQMERSCRVELKHSSNFIDRWRFGRSDSSLCNITFSSITSLFLLRWLSRNCECECAPMECGCECDLR